MAVLTRTTRFRFWRWLVRFIGVIVPGRFRARFRQEWKPSWNTAKSCWPGQQPIRKRFKGGSTNAYYEVIGVVKDVRGFSLAQVDGPSFYEPIKPANQLGLKFLIRTESDPRAFAGPLREAVREIDPSVLVSTTTLKVEPLTALRHD